MTLVTDIAHLAARALRKLVRNPILLFFSLFQPIIFLVLFTQLFTRFTSIPGFPVSNYLEFATPGILLQNAFSSALQSGTSVVDDINLGFLQKMLVTPVNRSAILLGRLTSDMIRVLIQSIIILALAYALGFTVATGAGGILIILVTIMFFGLAWSGISLAIGLRTKNTETVFGIGIFLTFPLLFVSTALVPLSLLPSWMQTVSKFNPISYTVDAVRALAITGFDWMTIAQAYAFIAAIAIVTLGATLYLFRKVVS